jgi:tryptophan synthase beta subunit
VDNEIASDHVADISGGSEDVLDGTKSKLVDSDPAELSHGISSRLDEEIAVQVPEHKVLLDPLMNPQSWRLQI